MRHMLPGLDQRLFAKVCLSWYLMFNFRMSFYQGGRPLILVADFQLAIQIDELFTTRKETRMK